jgi:hypothetical protein
VKQPSKLYHFDKVKDLFALFRIMRYRSLWRLSSSGNRARIMDVLTWWIRFDEALWNINEVFNLIWKYSSMILIVFLNAYDEKWQYSKSSLEAHWNVQFNVERTSNYKLLFLLLKLKIAYNDKPNYIAFKLPHTLPISTNKPLTPPFI